MSKSEKEKDEVFAEHFSEVLPPQNRYQIQKVEQDLATHIQSQERFKTSTSNK
jgi:hypothetical protein